MTKNDLTALQKDKDNKSEIERIAKKSAKIRTDPTKCSALTIAMLLRAYDQPCILTLMNNLKQQAERIIKLGETEVLEEILLAEAQTLHSLFNYMVERIPSGETFAQTQVYTDLAIKANNAARKTTLALQQLKSPNNATFIKQQNNAVNQQVNNCAIPDEREKNLNSANELLSEVTHEALDFGRTQEAVGINSGMEAMDSVNRADKH
jgi:hypothetical protein